MLAIVFVGYAEQRVVGDIYATLILCNGIDKGITGPQLATKRMPVNGLQYMQGTIRLLLHNLLCPIDKLSFLLRITCACTEHEGGQE
ncbi:MAG: hypothetical protein J6P55_01675 [Bacteroidaceae bacterium]|nr:hypothetical protein [Bacteroidaceae bacterium]